MIDLLILSADNGEHEYRNQLGLRHLGPYKVAWTARQHGYNVQVITKLQLLTLQQMKDICEPFLSKGTLIGISTTFLSVPKMSKRQEKALEGTFFHKLLELLRWLSARGHKIIGGGPKASSFEGIMPCDYYVNGPAENALPKLLDKIKRHGIQKRPYDWDIKTCGFRYNDEDCIQSNEVLPLETGRGCIFSCKFCGWSEIGKRRGTFETDISLIKRQLIDNYSRFGITHYNLADDTFNDDDVRMNEWCDMVESLPFEIKFNGYMRLDLMHRYKQTTKRLYDCGLRGCLFGIESFHPNASRVIGKAFNGKHAKDFLPELFFDIFEKNVIITTTNIVGLPGELPEDVYTSMEWYKQNNFIFATFMPLFLTKDMSAYLNPSAFAVEYEKYGYRFPSEDPRYWVTDIMDEVKAREVAMDVNKKLDRVSRFKFDGSSAMLHMAQTGIEPVFMYDGPYMDVQHSLYRSEQLIHQTNGKYFDAIRHLGEQQ